MPEKIDFLITNAAQILTMDNGLGIIAGGAVAVNHNKIIAIGKSPELKKHYSSLKTINATGKTLTPGLIDCHTHLVFAGTREHEYLARLKGASYLEILKQGGGILGTVENTRAASHEDLVSHGEKWLKVFLSHGVTTVEIKSGYGLNYGSEKKTLEVIRILKSKTKQEIVPTFLGAHAFPMEARQATENYVKELTVKMLPDFRGLAENCDIFLEKGAFSREQAEIILGVAQELGYHIKIHTNQMNSMGGIELAKKYKALSVEHLDKLSGEEIDLLAESGAVAVLLPGASFFLQEEKWAPAVKLLDKQIPVALSTDFNPGSCPSPNLHLIMSLAAQKLNMPPVEIWRAVTINAAKALDREKELGSITVGKKAHLVLWDMPNYLYPFYHFGMNFVEKVFV